MLNKTFDDLSMKEKFELQKIMKKKRNNDVLNADEEALYDKFSENFIAVEQSMKAKWPIIIGLLLVSALAILRH